MGAARLRSKGNGVALNVDFGLTGASSTQVTVFDQGVISGTCRSAAKGPIGVLSG